MVSGDHGVRKEGSPIYGKIFDSIYDGTLRANWQALVTFQQLIILADKDGIIDMTPHAIHGRTGIPLEIIESGLDHLSKPDPYSRSSAEEGRRIVLLDEHRPWGWRLVNHAYYNSIRSAAEKREADRTRVYAKRAGEEKHKDGFVYFIGCDDDGPIKIGFSQNPWARLTELQTGSHSKFEVLCAVKGAHADERSFHKEFSTLRIQGEWFKRDTSLIKKIKELSSSQELREECSETQDYVAHVAPVAVSVSTTTETNPLSGDARPQSDVQTVFQHWQQKLNHPQAKLTPERQRKISTALKNYSAASLCKAIDGCAVTPHNMGQNDRGEVYDDIELIVRGAKQIERFMRNADSPPKPNGGNHATRQPTDKPSLAERASDARRKFEQQEDAKRSSGS